jgi:hypothetical protein
LKIDLSLSNPDNRVEYEFWFSSILDMSVESVAQLGEYQKPFGNHTLFTPRIVTFSCPGCPPYIRETNCLSDGQYCPYRSRSHEEQVVSKDSALSYHFLKDDKTLDTIDKITDKEIMMENLRSKCIYLHSQREDPTMVLGQWFRYMYAMNSLTMSSGQLNQDWSDSILHEIGIDTEEIHDCVENSFEEPGNYKSDNKLLKEDRWWQRIMDV